MSMPSRERNAESGFEFDSKFSDSPLEVLDGITQPFLKTFRQNYLAQETRQAKHLFLRSFGRGLEATKLRKQVDQSTHSGLRYR
jgi:hypothetical protein